MRRRMMMGGIRLPLEYQEVEYVGVVDNSEAYIRTNLTITSTDFSLNVKVFLMGENIANHYAICGTSKCYIYTPNHTYRWKVTIGSSVKLGLDTRCDNTKFFNITVSGNIYTYSNSVYSISGNYSGSPISTSQMCVFAAGGEKIMKNCKIKEVIFIQQNQTALYLIPCYRKSDGEIGMYDIINCEFYSNAGTGSFIKGNDVK